MRRPAQYDITYQNITTTRIICDMACASQSNISYATFLIFVFSESIPKDIEYLFKEFCVIFWKISRSISKNIENN